MDKAKPFWGYILQNPAGRYYIGSTGDLPARVEHHNTLPPENPGWTQKHGPWQLVWQESHADCASAVRRERPIKARKSSRWIRQALLNKIV